MTEDLITLTDIAYRIDGKQILSKINLLIRQNSFQVILGANGAGKSTLLKIIANLLTASSGRNELASDVKISYLGHQLQLYVDLSVYKNLVFFKRFFGWSFDVTTILQEWGLATQSEVLVKNLSQGQGKRLALALHFACPANVYILDEPGSNLDHQGKQLLLQKLAQLKSEKNKSVVLVAHELADYQQLASHILYLGSAGLELVHQEQQGTITLSELNHKYLELLQR